MWIGNISIKTNGGSDINWDDVKKWPEIEKVWSTTGTWDWWIKLKPNQANHLDAAEKIVWSLRKKPWITETQTWWAKEC